MKYRKREQVKERKAGKELNGIKKIKRRETKTEQKEKEIDWKIEKILGIFKKGINK